MTTTKSKAFLSTGALAAIAGFSLLGGTAIAKVPAQGQTPGAGTSQANNPRPVHVVGRVDSLSGTGLVLETRRGDVTVNVSDRTWVVVEENGQCVEGDLSDIQTGRPASVAGMSAAQGTVDARTLLQGRCQRAARGQVVSKAARLARHMAAGTITAINSNTITLKPERGNRDVTVNTTANTQVFNNGFKPVSSLKVGDEVYVLGRPQKPAAGQPNSNAQQGRTITAWALKVDNGTTQAAVGRVESVSGNTLTVKTPKNRGGITVTLDGSTSYKSLSASPGQVSVTNAAQADVKVGSHILLEGTTTTDGKTMSTKAVVLLP